MKVFTVFLVLVFMITGYLFAVQNQHITTEPDIGIQIRYSEANVQKVIDPSFTINSKDDRVELIWQMADGIAIAGDACVSSTTMNSFVDWYLNYERVSLYNNSTTPLWESFYVNENSFGSPIDMTEDGSVMAMADDFILKIFTPSTSTPTWNRTVDFTINGVVLNPEGSKVYIMYTDYDQSISFVECYSIGDSIPEWSINFESSSSTLSISGDGSTLVFTQYYNHMWVLDADDGSIIFDGPNKNQNPPAISYDGSVIVNGDYYGYVYVYEYNETLDTYDELWNYHVDGGGTSNWIGGMGISKDGSTIAIGTLSFVTGGYNGQLYVFNSYSPIPLWIYDDMGDYVIDVDLTDDGSLIAVASWGPVDNSTSDFFLFNRESEIPIFEINTMGSLECVDMAGDGFICTTGGKAVHERVSGSGGFLYCINCDPLDIEESATPLTTKIGNNFPNPFSGSTTFSFSGNFNRHDYYQVSIYNVKGELVKDLSPQSLLADTIQIEWNGKDDCNHKVNSGLYFYTLKINGKTEVIEKCLLVNH